MSRKLTTALVFALVLTMALSVSAFAQGPSQAGTGACANCVDANGDGVCDNWIDSDGDGVNDSAPRDGSGQQLGQQAGRRQNAQSQNALANRGRGTGAGLYGAGEFVDANGDGVCDAFVDADGDGMNDSAPQDGTGNQHGKAGAPGGRR